MSDFWFYFKWGWRHIISTDALDHQLFIVVLAALYTIKEWRPVLVLVTAFTVGHSITLGLSIFNVVSVGSSFVEFLIPCTIAVTALSNFFYKNLDPKNFRPNYVLALLFGLIHGLGFANALRFSLASDQSLAKSLFAFNLGLEAGQVVVVLLLLTIAYLAVFKLRLNRKWWVWVLSGAAFFVAVKMALDRWPAFAGS